jgi:hypothetical protein
VSSARTRQRIARQGEKIIVTVESKEKGGGTKVNGRQLPNNAIDKSDIEFDGGVIHVRRHPLRQSTSTLATKPGSPICCVHHHHPQGTFSDCWVTHVPSRVLRLTHVLTVRLISR